MVIKVYMTIWLVLSAVSAVGVCVIHWAWKLNKKHNCKTCAHCALVEPGTDGKLIYTCGRTGRIGEQKFYYDYAVPVFCGYWQRRKGLWMEEGFGDDS